MRKIFIDSNIYLGFYNSVQPEFKKLLTSLIELSDKILVTYQIIDEVNRNKLHVFKQSIDNYLSKVIFFSTKLPEHLDNENEKIISEWNKKRKALEKNAREISDELDGIIKNKISDIAFSKDKISVDLKKVFIDPLKGTQNTFKKATIRRKIGNPPGKLEDPLGDQINWVLLLENCKEISELWIVSKDRDYFIEHKNKLFLNPLLYNELLAITPNLKIYMFSNLVEALRDFDSKEKIQALPPKTLLGKIEKEEQDEKLPKALRHHGNIKFYGGGHGLPIVCPKCKTADWYDPAGFLPSKFGGQTYQYKCKNCGNLFDTGDYGDEDPFGLNRDEYNS